MERMKKVFHFEAQRANYECDAAVVCCFDNRFRLGFNKFLKRKGIENPDVIRVAGGAKCLASPEPESQREFVTGQIRTSIRLHATKRVILMVHSDCGGYGGLARFDGDALREREHHRKELERAAEYVREQFPDLEVGAYFVDFEGVWAVGAEQESTAKAAGVF
jgi:carbonic anhydrase